MDIIKGSLPGLIALLSIQAALAQPQCSDSVEILPIGNVIAHRDFPVDLRAKLSAFPCRMVTYRVESAPPEVSIDGAGGLFYWTPKQLGIYPITISIFDTLSDLVLDYETFQVTVDDNTITYPLWRDYRTESTTIPVIGRAYGKDFVSYRLDYAYQAEIPSWKRIVGPVYEQAPQTRVLGKWNVSSLPDGGRFMLRLSVLLKNGTKSEVINQVILDRTLKTGWSKRIGAITHSPTVFDLNNDGKDEVIVLAHSGELHVWSIYGRSFLKTAPDTSTYSGVSVGDINGDRVPEMVWASITRIHAHRLDGAELPGFPLSLSQSDPFEYRATPTLADINGDGVLDVIVALRNPTAVGKVAIYRYDNSQGRLVSLPGWPKSINHFEMGASVSVGDLDGDRIPEIVTSSKSRAYVFRPDGSSYPGWSGGAPLPVEIGEASTNGGGSATNTSQPALADIDRDGKREIIIGTNVFRYNGGVLRTLTANWIGRSDPTSLSPAVADVDLNPNNGLEIVLGPYAWHANGVSMHDFPFSEDLCSAVLGDCGGDHLDIMAGTKFSLAPGIVGFHSGHGLAPVVSYPKSLYGETGDYNAPVLGDFDKDGLIDIAATITDASYGGIVAVYNMPVVFRPERNQWPMVGHNVLHTGYFGCIPKRVDASSCVCGMYDLDGDNDGIGNCND